MKQWKRLAALSSAIVMAAATLTYFPSDILQNIRLEISASAETTTEPQVWIEDNLTWTLTADGTLTISGTGAMKDYDYNNNQSPVYMNSSVKKVVIEDGVTSIGNWAFYKCTSLTTITIPDSVTSIGDWAFYKCTSLTTITIPDSVTSIGEAAFRGCSSLTSITIPDSVTSIGDAAFSHCSNLKSITIPDSITSIGKYAFCNCSSLTSITIPNSVTSIGESALAGCVNLTSITIPKSVTSIGSGVFDGCNNLTVYLESGSTLTSNDLGVNESKIGSYWVEDNLTWKLDADGTLTISGTGAMKDYDYNNNPSPANQKKGSVKKVVIKDGVTSIGKDAFKNCSNLKSITILDSVTSIGDFAFSDCSSLTSITILDSVTSIGDFAFSDCSSLTSITIPDSVTSIGDFAFSGCSSLTSITILDSVTSITIPDSVTRIGDFAFSGCSSLTSITIPDSVTSIGDDAFSYCRSLTSITIPDRVTSIGNLAFYDCSGLTSITIPDSVTSIGEYAFQSCSSLTSITIPDSVTSIGDYVFISCSSLTTISLSCKSSLKRSDFGGQADLVSYASHTLNKTEAKAATCTEDGNNEYWTCEHCGKYFLSDDTNPETAKAVELSETILPAIQHKNAELRNASEPTETEPGYSGDRYCPDCNTVLEKGYTYWNEDNLTWTLDYDGKLTISGTGAMKDYNADDNPSPAYNNSKVKKIVIEKGVTSVGDYAFRSCNNLTSIMISNSVTSIGNSAFFYCTSLTSVTIPDNVTSIENYAFAYTGLKSITIPDSVTNIGNYAFAGCKDLTSITIPDSVTSIGNSAFYNCSSLTSITIPDSVTSIGTATFSGCKNLTSITIPDSVTSIGNSAFVGCKNLTSITIPDSVTSIGESTFKYCSNLKTISLSCKSSLKRNDFGEQADLVSYTNQHLLTKTAAKDATCSEDGNKEYWTCEHCGKYFLSDDANPETATAVELSETVIPASHKLTKVNAKDATCAKDGNKEYWTCEHCGKYFLSDDTNPETATAVEQSETVIPALKHKNATTRGASEPTETEPGYSGDRYCPDCDTVLEKGYTYWNESNLIWKLDADGTLTISGTGKMKNYNADYNLSPVYMNSKVKKVVIEKGVTTIGKYAFCNCTSLTDITIPDSVTSIGDFAFRFCSSLTSITISDSVTSIGNWAFLNCSSLTSITIPDRVTSIGDDAFYNCSNLTSITIPKNVTSIGNSVFENCSNLTDITIPDCVTSIGNWAFLNCSSLTSITIPDRVTSIGKDAFYNCSGLTSITIPDSVTSIGDGAFSECSSLTDIVIPSSVTSIGNRAFENCSSLTSITIPDSVTSIGNGAFAGCSSLKSITIPDSVTSIGNRAFENCSSLTSITIPDSVTSIGKSAFYKCSSLTTISLSCKSTLKKSNFGEQADLVSYTNQHLLTKTAAKAATCSESGNKEYWTCEHCKKYFLSDDTNPETAKAVEQSETIIPASHKLTKVEAKAATCTEDGNKEYWTCEHCGKYFLSDDTNPETAKAVKLSETVIPALVQVATTTTPIKCVYGQDMNKIDLRDYVKNTDVVGEVTVKVATGSTLPDGMKLDNGKISGKPAKAYEDSKEVTFTFTAENGSTANLTLLFLVEKADPTVEVAVSGDSHTEGDLVGELELILSENSTKGVVELVSEIKALVAGKNTLTWKFTPEDENNYHTVTGTVVVNAQTTTTTTTKATTTTKPSKTTTTKVTTTTKPNKTTTTKVTTTTKPSKTTTTNVTTTTKPSKTTTTNVTTTTKPSKTTTTNATTTNTAIPSYGDVNLDGKVDIVDAIFLNKYLATLIQFSDAQMANADCCQDGVLNDQDTTALMQFIILLIDDLPVQPTEK